MQRLITASGGTVVLGGKVFDRETKHVEPTMILKPDLDSELMTDEIFGPILPIITYRSFDEVVDFINDRDKPLAVYYFGVPDSMHSTQLKDETSSGAFMTNDCVMHAVSHY